MQEKGLAVVKGQKRSIPTDYSALKRAELKQAIEKYIFGHLPPEVPEAEKQFLLNFALSLGLNPWKGEIYFIPYKTKEGTKVQTVVSYLVYISRAEQSGKLDGWEVEIGDDGKKAICRIWRKDWSRPFVWTTYLDEVNRGSKEDRKKNLWDIMPRFMLRKVCIAQAFRLAFPGEVGELPYIPEEVPIEAEAEIVDTRPQPQPQPQSQSLPSAPEKEEKEDPRVAQARKLAEAKGVEIDAEPTDTEWVRLYSAGILTGKLAKGQKMSALLARLRKSTQPAQEGESESKQAEARQSELLKK